MIKFFLPVLVFGCVSYCSATRFDTTNVDPDQKKDFERFEFKILYTANQVFKDMSSSEIEKEISAQTNRAIAIKLYWLAKRVQSRPLKPLCDLLAIRSENPQDCDELMYTIERDANQKEIKLFFCQRVFGKTSQKDLESEIYAQSEKNENLAYGLYELASSCAKNLKSFEDLIKAQKKAQN